MKKQFQLLKLLVPALLLIISLSSHAQQQFIHTATKANNSGNGDATWLDIPELNNNPSAIIFVTTELVDGMNLNPHPIGVFYFQKKWNIFNLDQRVIPEDARFNVVYFTRPGSDHFLYTIKQEDIQTDGAALINHPALNGNPNAQVRFLNSWGYEAGVPVSNRDEVNFQYNAAAGKWAIANINKKSLFAQVAYNIIIFTEENPLPGQGKDDPVLSKLDPKTYKKPADTTAAAPVQGDPINVIKTLKTIIKPAETINKIDIVTKTSIPPSYDFSNVHICIDKGVIKNVPPKAASAVPVIPKIKPNGEIETISTILQPLTGFSELMWSPGQQITVGFSPDALTSWKLKIENYVKEWEIYANIHFVFLNHFVYVNEENGDLVRAQIKIGFRYDGTSWSWVGRQVLDNPAGEMTMNFGWFDTKSTEAELKRVVLHEFGHALGFIDEFQPPMASGISWNQEKTYNYFEGLGSDWNRERVDLSVFAKYAKVSSNSSQYDRLSVMHYSYPPGLTTDGSTFPLNMNLSEADKAFAKQVYPFPRIPPTATGVLNTGDDCDEIEFTVEYNVIHFSEIEFTLKPGRAPNGNLITWWKKIAIPELGGSELGLEMQDGYSITKKIQENMIDRSKGISFGKAKFAGVHTGLGYTWDAWPAIVGGCRVTLVWRRDSCN